MKAADCGVRSCHPSRFAEHRGVCTDTVVRRPDFVGGNRVTVGWLLLLLATLLLWLLRATPVRAAGVVGTGTPESCTEAALDAALAGGGLVTFDCGAGPVTITVTNEKLISGPVTIEGNGLVTLSGGGAVRVFRVDEPGMLDLRDLTVAHGRVRELNNGGGILNEGTLTVTNSTVSSNGAPHSAAGGIFNEGTLTVTNSTFSGNSADSGGGIVNGGMLTVTNSTFSGNHVGGFEEHEGGAIINGGTLTVTNSTFSDNSADYGAGIVNYGTLTVTNSTFSDNSSDATLNVGTLTVTNSTFFGNIGGGIGNFRASPSLNGALTVTNTIIANNIGGDCFNEGTFTDGGHNLIGDAENACDLTNGVNGNIVGVDPLLDPAGLQDNGGRTETIALLPGSPAIDAGDPEVCADPPVDGLDQRGYVRPGTGSANCSIGAYEFDFPGPPCTGDCDAEGKVEIHELITLVNIALGLADVSRCEAGDRNLNGEISIDEIIAAVSYALADCPAVADPRFDTLARVVEAEMAERGVRAAAIAVVEDGKVAYVDGFGTLADDDDTPVDADTLFAIGSLSKSFTAITLLSAIADDPSVTLDTPVQDILPEFAFPPAETQHLITLRTLLEHSSTLPRPPKRFLMASVPDPADASTRRLLTDVLPNLVANGYAQWTQPGHLFHYSNLGFMIAGLAAEAITGSSYPDLLRDRVTTPLGLERTFARAADVEAAGNFALGAPAVTPASLDDAAVRPAGGVWSSARDMAEYLVFQLEGDDRVLSQADLTAMQSPQVPTGGCLSESYGFGLAVSDALFDTDASVYYPVDVVFHDGDRPGFYAQMAFFPERGDGYVILNASDDGLPDTQRHLHAAVFELPAEPRPDLSGDPEEWARWEGTFYDPHHVFGRLTLTRVGDDLRAELPDLPAWFLRGFTNLCGNQFLMDTALGYKSGIILTEDLAGEPNLIRIDVPSGVFERVP